MNTIGIPGSRPSCDGLRIVFDCPAAMTLLDPGEGGRERRGGIGGAEVRAFTFAKWLATEAGHDVAFVVNAEDPEATRRQADGLAIHFEPRHYSPDSPTWSKAWNRVRSTTQRISRSVLKRMTGLPEPRPFYTEFPWDVLVAMGVTNRTATLVRTARQLQRPAIVCLTTDRTLDDFRRKKRYDRGVYGEQGHCVRYALQHASAVIAQTQYQQAALRRLGIVAEWIPNPIELRPAGRLTTPVHCSSPGSKPFEGWGKQDVRLLLPEQSYVLWVGRADTFSKRADVAIEVARRCRTWPMVLIMNRHDDVCYRQLTTNLPDNVHLIERVEYDQIEDVYRRAAVLLNTSVAEGFPNSFLQAGKYGVPVISHRVDPDQMLTLRRAGICCHGDFDAMCDAIDRCMQNPADRMAYSNRIQEYVQQNHDLHRCGAALARLIQVVNERDGFQQRRQIA